MIDSRQRNEKEKEPSSKEFGFVFAAVFALAFALPLLRHRQPRWWAIPVSLFFLAAALFFPALLKPLAKIWMKIGLLLHKVMNPLILGVVFFLVFTPFGLLLRAFGMKFLKLGWEKNAKSYWVDRSPPGPDQLSFKNQF